MELELKHLGRLLLEDLKYARATKNKEYEKLVLDAQNEFHKILSRNAILTAQLSEISATAQAAKALLSRDNL